MARTNPDVTPPIVSIEKDFPGLIQPVADAECISLTKVNPDTRQKGNRTTRVSTMLPRKDGVSPVSRKSLDKIIRRNNEIKGLTEKTKLILALLMKSVLPAIAAPDAEAISQEPRKIPVISSYPPVILSTSLRRRNWTDMLVNPTIKRLVITDDGSGVSLL